MSRPLIWLTLLLATLPVSAQPEPQRDRRADFCHTCARDSRGRIKRSRAVVRSFQRIAPCPSTRRASGPCPGYRADHLVPLACGGADAVANLQWLTIAEWKAKSKVERRGCTR